MHNAQSCEKRGKKERGITHALFQHCEKEKNTSKVGGIVKCISFCVWRWKETWGGEKKQQNKKKLKGKDAPHPKP
jgi:hypothetical protein